MERLPIAFARAGHILAAPVQNSHGAILCPAGCQLTETLLGRLRSAGVVTVTVEGRRSSPNELQERLAQLEKRATVVRDPQLLALCDAARQQLHALLREQHRPEGGERPR